jgi:hypothetical protein
VAIQREITGTLLKERIDSPGVLSTTTKEELRSLGISLGDASRILAAANAIHSGPSSSSSPASSHPAQPKQVLDPSKATVMISYQWDSKPVALQVRDHLLSLEPFNAIMDMTGIHGNFLEWMEESVQASDALLLLVTPKYQMSTNCRAEACRAHELKKKMVPITLDPLYSGAGWLAPMIAPSVRQNELNRFDL